MGSKCAYLENAILNTVLGGDSFTAPATVYIALSTQPFADASTGSSMDEVSGSAYARVAMTNDSTSWPAATSQPAVKTNGIAIDFPTASGGDWGTIQSFYILDASSAGNALFGADLSTGPQAINDGDTASFDIGALTVIED